MTIDPLAPLRALAYCVIALIIGLVAGYVYGHQAGAAEHLPAITALKGSVDSCNTAAATANDAVAADRKAAADREARVADVLEKVNPAIAAASRRDWSRATAAPLRGDTECAQLKNAVDDHLRGARP